MKALIVYVALLYGLLYALPSNAQEVQYHWNIDGASEGSGLNGTTYPTPDAACAAVAAWVIPHNTNWIKSISAVFWSTTRYACQGKGETGNTSNVAFANRVGNKCPAGSKINSATGLCDPDCAPTEGTMTTHLFSSHTRPTADAPWPSDSPSPPGAICKNSCRYRDAPQENLTCGPLRDGDPLQQFCIGMFIGEGTKCEAGDVPQQSSGDIGGPPEVPPENPDDPTDPANNCGPTHVWSGSTCVPIFTPDPTDPTDPTSPPGGGGGGGSGDGSGGGSGGDGGGDGDGSGGGGSGGGTGGGGGCGGGSCPSDGGDDGEGHDWYVPGDLTMEGVLGDFNDRMSKAPFMTSSKQFFTVNASGSCPVWQTQAWKFNIVFDQHCSTQMPWDLIKGVLLALASFVAFRWAFL